MPIIKSAKKRVKVARKATIRNVKTKRSLKTALKAFQAAVSSGKKADETQRKVQSNLGKAAKKGVMHKNKVARKQRQLAAAAKAAGVKTAGAKKATAKPTTKSAAKKTPAKKPVAKKATKK